MAIKNPQPDGMRLASVSTLAAFRLISRHLNFRRARYNVASRLKIMCDFSKRERGSPLSDSLAHASGWSTNSCRSPYAAGIVCSDLATKTSTM